MFRRIDLPLNHPLSDSMKFGRLSKAFDWSKQVSSDCVNIFDWLILGTQGLTYGQRYWETKILVSKARRSKAKIAQFHCYHQSPKWDKSVEKRVKYNVPCDLFTAKHCALFTVPQPPQGECKVCCRSSIFVSSPGRTANKKTLLGLPTGTFPPQSKITAPGAMNINQHAVFYPASIQTCMPANAWGTTSPD